MPFSYARTDNIGKTNLDLEKAFSCARKNGIQIHDLANHQNTRIGEKSETLQLSPWEISLNERIINLIAQGYHGKALDLIGSQLNNPDFSDQHKEDIVKALQRALDTLENNGFDYQIQNFISIMVADTALTNEINNISSTLLELKGEEGLPPPAIQTKIAAMQGLQNFFGDLEKTPEEPRYF